MEESGSVLRNTDDAALRLAHTLLRTARHGSIATLEPDTGSPLASRVGVATDIDGTPLILVSALAAHTGAVLHDPRCSLLIGEPGKGDPLAHPRISISCKARRLETATAGHARAERRYLNHNPKAQLYAGLGDFSLFRLEVEGASLNGGFGKAYALSRVDLVDDDWVVNELAKTEQSALDHMNAEHLDAVALYARQCADAVGDGWRMAGIDARGFTIASGDAVGRVFFPAPLTGAAGLRGALVDLARDARARELAAR